MDLGNKAEELKGKAKEAYGNATDNTQAKVEGKADQAKAAGQQFGEDVKNAADNARESLSDNDDN